MSDMADDIAAMGFEEAFTQLEEVVQRLEAGNLPLEEALGLFERGTLLARRCNAHLDAAELKIKQLTPDDLTGYRLEPFEED